MLWKNVEKYTSKKMKIKTKTSCACKLQYCKLKTYTIFKYTNSLGRKYDKNAKITSITFDISRYGKHKHTLQFTEPITERAAIGRVQKWLSQSVTKEYFDVVKDDLFGRGMDGFSHEEFETRGDLLTSLIFLERISTDKMGHAVIQCGS